MATEISKIDASDLVGHGVIGLPDAPELSTLAMQEAFEDVVRNVVIPHINGMADEIDAAVDGAIETAHNEVQAEKTRAQGIEAGIVGGTLDQFAGVTFENMAPDQVLRSTNSSGNMINSYLKDCRYDEDHKLSDVIGGGVFDSFMLKTTYDADGNGVVDNSEALNGHDDTYFAKSADVGDVSALETTSKTVVGAINELEDRIPSTPEFSVNFTTGELEYTYGDDYSFSINTTTGNLEWEVVA